MSERLIVRPARPSDAARIAELAGQLGYPSDPTTVGERMAILASDPDRVLMVAVLAEQDGAEQVVGWIELEFRAKFLTGRVGEIAGLVVDAAVRRSGAGRALVAWAESETRRRGLTTLCLRSNAQRVEAGAFYPALGFAMTKLSRYYTKSLAKSESPADRDGQRR